MTDGSSPASTAPAAPTADATDLLAQVNAMGAGTLVERLGITFTEVSRERLVATMPVAGNTQPYGLLHGGASAALAETIGSIGAVLAAGPGRVAVGVDLNATHHRAVRDGLVTGTGTVLHAGRTTACFEIVVTDEQGRRVCTSRLTCQLRDAPPA